MEVNFFAMVAVCKATFPLLRETRGRFVNMISVAGLASAPLMSGYSASKHAAEAFSMCLRAECDPWGIKVRAWVDGAATVTDGVPFVYLTTFTQHVHTCPTNCF